MANAPAAAQTAPAIKVSFLSSGSAIGNDVKKTTAARKQQPAQVLNVLLLLVIAPTIARATDTIIIPPPYKKHHMDTDYVVPPFEPPTFSQ